MGVPVRREGVSGSSCGLGRSRAAGAVSVYRDGMKWGPWLENTRQNPREALEAELSVMVAGLVIVFVGGSATFAGFVNRGGATSPQPLAGAP